MKYPFFMNTIPLAVLALPLPTSHRFTLASPVIFNFSIFFLLLPSYTHSPNLHFLRFFFIFLYLQLQDLNPGLPLQGECPYHCTTPLAFEYTTVFLGNMNYSSQAHLGQMYKLVNILAKRMSQLRGTSEEHL